METLFKQIGEILKKRIAADIKAGRNLDLVRNAYNYWREDEHDGTEYVFSIFDKDDFKYVVDNDLLDQYGIVWAVHNTQIGCFFFPCDINAEGVTEINREDLKSLLIANLDSVLPNMFKYICRGEDTPYQQLYEEYVVNELEKIRY